MLDLRRIVNDTEAVRAGLAKRGEEDAPIDEVISLDRQRRELIQQTDSARQLRNEVSRRIGDEKRRPTDDEIQQMRSTGDKISELETEARSVANELRTLMLGLPNIPLGDVPEGFRRESATWSFERNAEPPPAREWDTPHWEVSVRVWASSTWRARRICRAVGFICCGGKGRGCIERSSGGCWIRWSMSLGMRKRIRRFLCARRRSLDLGNLPKFADDQYRDNEAGFVVDTDFRSFAERHPSGEHHFGR